MVACRLQTIINRGTFPLSQLAYYSFLLAVTYEIPTHFNQAALSKASKQHPHDARPTSVPSLPAQTLILSLVLHIYFAFQLFLSTRIIIYFVPNKTLHSSWINEKANPWLHQHHKGNKSSEPAAQLESKSKRRQAPSREPAYVQPLMVSSFKKK